MADVPSDLVVRFPARRGYLGISRLNATALAADNGFDVDELDDLRLAIDEAVAWLIDGHDDENRSGSTDDEIELVIRCRQGQLDFRGTHSRPGSGVPPLTDLAQAVLAVTVDDHDTSVDPEGRRTVTLAKSSSTDA